MNWLKHLFHLFILCFIVNSQLIKEDLLLLLDLIRFMILYNINIQISWISFTNWELGILGQSHLKMIHHLHKVYYHYNHCYNIMIIIIVINIIIILSSLSILLLLYYYIIIKILIQEDHGNRCLMYNKKNKQKLQ